MNLVLVFLKIRGDNVGLVRRVDL